MKIKNILKFSLRIRVIRKVIRKKRGSCGHPSCLGGGVIRKVIRKVATRQGGVIRNPQTYIVCGCGKPLPCACGLVSAVLAYSYY